MSTWRWAAASAIGTAHLRNGTRLQDAYHVGQSGNSTVAIVADGAGSATFGAQGAWLTCRHLSVRLREWVTADDTLPPDEMVFDWFDELRDRIGTIASKKEITPRQFAATVVGLLVFESAVLTLQVGDSALVARSDDEWSVLAWPENGEYASSTYFVTDDPAPRLRIKRYENEYDAFALFSDGVGDLALVNLESAAHRPFFDAMIAPVDRSSMSGRLAELSQELRHFLGQSRVTDRTDDDKSLVLMSRR